MTAEEHRSIAHRLRDASGSAVAEFPMVAALIVVIAIAVIQTAVMLHVRNTVTDAAVQGAHEAAIHGHTIDDGERRTRALISQQLGSYRADVSAYELDDGQITVTVRGAMPLIGVLGPGGTLTVTGQAISEEAL